MKYQTQVKAPLYVPSRSVHRIQFRSQCKQCVFGLVIYRESFFLFSEKISVEGQIQTFNIRCFYFLYVKVKQSLIVPFVDREKKGHLRNRGKQSRQRL